MTLLDDYRRAVYATTEDERRRRLTPLAGAKPQRGFPTTTTSEIRRNSPSAPLHRGKKLKPSRSFIRLETLSPSTDLSASAADEPQVDGDSDGGRSVAPRQHKQNSKGIQTQAARTRSNQSDSSSGHSPSQPPPLLKKPSVLNRLAVLAVAAEWQGRSRAFCTPSELPSQFIHGSPHINISRWTTIVSDLTLHRIAARNRRLHNTLQQKLARHVLLGNATMSSVLPPSFRDNRCENETATLTRSIIMNGAEQITDVGLQAIAETVPTLEALEIAHAARVTDAGLRVVAAHCPSLQRLNLGGCFAIRGAGLGAIAELCPRVRDLQLADCVQLGEWVFQKCFYSFAVRLEHLNAARCTQITDALLKTLAHECPSLRSLQLTDCTQVSDVGIVQLAQKCPQLEKIVLSRSLKSEKLTDTSCAALGEHCPLLRDVQLAGCNFLTDAGVQWIASGCSRLETLDLSNVFYVTDAAMRALSQSCPQLRSLKITNVKNVSDVGLRFLATGCTLLETLHASNLYLVSDGSNRDFGLEGLQAIAKGCLQIRDLNLSGCFQLVERALIALGATCHRLTRINLKACPKITLLAVNALLHGCPLLASLNLSGVSLCNNAMLAAIATHGTALKELYIAQCDAVGDAGLRQLARRADQLEVLDLSGCVLLTDTGVSALIEAFQHPALMHLYLVGCSQVTQDPIARLAFACPLLLTLSVHGCRVSARVLQSLSSSWPFGKLRVPTAATRSGAELGIFPVHRAKDKRFVEESCSLWAAAVKVQNLFRRRLARRDAHVQREHAQRVFVARRLQSLWRGRRARREAMLRKLLRSGLEKSAIKIQRQYRALRQSRKVQTQLHAVLEQQTEKYAVFVQRKYRAKRAATIANAIVQALRNERRRETQAATLLQRRFRGIAARKRFNVMQIQRRLVEREQREASLRIQAIYRGRKDRQKVKQIEHDKQLEIQRQHACATQIQCLVRRRLARSELRRRREYQRFRECCATRLQTQFRARRARVSIDLMRLARRQAERECAAVLLQRHWRGRIDRLGFAVLAEAKRRRFERELNATIQLQRTFRRFAIRKRARGVMEELLHAKQRDDKMEIWAATLVQAHWRRRQASRELERVQSEKRSRWKQLVDTYNQHGMGYGAPFFYNQVNGEIRWRMPREILVLEPRAPCDQCATPFSATVECATCGELFCDCCHEIVHARGKRRTHTTRKLFNFYGMRRDYGDGDFPSIWPTEIQQDLARGYDFVTQRPKDTYQEMLWRIAQFVPVETEPTFKKKMSPPSEVTVDDTVANPPKVAESISAEHEDISDNKAGTTSLDGVLFLEADVDEQGNSLWESFFDYSSQEYRYYHRVSKRVAPLYQGSPAEPQR